MFKSIFKVVAVSAVAAFFSIGCGGGGGNPADNTGGGGGGTLTVTGLPSAEHRFAYVFKAGTDISTLSAVMNVIQFTGPANDYLLAAGIDPSGNVFSLNGSFTGSGNFPILLVMMNPQTEYRRATVNFTNGSATVSFSSFTLVAGTGGGDPVDPNDPNTGGSGKLTITGLPSGTWSATVHAAGTDISYGLAISNNSIAKGGVTANIGNVFTLYRANETPSPSTYWTGSGSLPVSLLDGSGKDAADGIYFRRATVTFSNGSATVSFNSFTPVTDLSGGGNPVDPNDPNTGGGGRSHLTVTGLPSGNYTVAVFATGYTIDNIPCGNNGDPLDFLDAAGIFSSAGNGTGLFVAKKYADDEYELWTGSGRREVLLINTDDDGWRATVTFTNGSATVPFSSFTPAASPCGDDDDDGGDPPDNPGGGDPSESWPSGGMLSEFGIDGLTMPSGATDVEWFKMSDASTKGLMITAATTANFSYFENYFESNGWEFVQEMSSSTVTAKVWQKSSQSQTLQATCSKNSSDNSLTLVVSIEYKTGDD
jgi:hypothetical protein